MTAKALNQPIREVYCPHCHLATRASSERCLHCGQTVQQDYRTRLVSPKARVVGRSLDQLKRMEGSPGSAIF